MTKEKIDRWFMFSFAMTVYKSAVIPSDSMKCWVKTLSWKNKFYKHLFCAQKTHKTFLIIERFLFHGVFHGISKCLPWSAINKWGSCKSATWTVGIHSIPHNLATWKWNLFSAVFSALCSPVNPRLESLKNCKWSNCLPKIINVVITNQ